MTEASNLTTQEKSERDPFFGKMLDADGHFYMEEKTFNELFADSLGPKGGGFVMEYIRKFATSDEHLNAKAGNRDNFFETKGLSALGAYDPQERVEALDRLGVVNQLVYPNTFGEESRLNTPEARRACSAYNDFAIEWTKAADGRARAMCQIAMDECDWAIGEVDRVIKRGAQGFVLPHSRPPGGVSPAHESWDPFWARIEDANVPVTLHLGGQGLLSGREGDEMMPDRAWGNSQILKNGPGQKPDIPIRAGGEEAISPYFMLVAHMAPELYLQTMVMGGVFERFPKLRFGVIECGASWLGPTVERMDIWVDFQRKMGVNYAMRPSEYVRRNVRVTPFWHEDLPRMIDRYGMEEVYLYSTDYPHLEGSKDPIGKFRKWLARMDESYAQKFFVDNARLLFPDA